MTESRMYKESIKQISPHVGCYFGCVYCEPSFKRQSKRQKQRCNKCYHYIPHFHPERLRTPPRTKDGEFIFLNHSGDIAHCSCENVRLEIEWIKKYPDRTFLIQSKRPECFNPYLWPENVYLGTTIETDLPFFDTPSIVESYEGVISLAPMPLERYQAMLDLNHPYTFVTIEPILDFSDILVHWIRDIEPLFVYVGYDTHNCKLPEPRLEKTLKLIEKLEQITEVRLKTIRKAWYEELQERRI